jgi:hypothetical protein
VSPHVQIAQIHLLPSLLLINIHPLRPQILLGHLNLLHQLGIRIGRVAEGQHAPAEAEEQPRAEGDEEPEGELYTLVNTCCQPISVYFYLSVHVCMRGCMYVVDVCGWFRNETSTRGRVRSAAARVQ